MRALALGAAGEVGHLQAEAEGGKPLHEHLALVGRDGGDVDGALLEDEGEALVGVGGLALLAEDGRARVHGIVRVGAPGVPDLEAGAEVEFGRSLGRGGFALGGLPGEGAAVGVDVEDAQPRFAPAGSAVFHDRDAAAQAGDKTAHDEIRGVGAARGGLEGGQVHGHALKKNDKND